MLPITRSTYGDCHGYFADQVADLLGDGRTAELALAAQARPMVSETLALPGDHRAWLHDNERLPPPGRNIDRASASVSVQRLVLEEPSTHRARCLRT